MVHLVNDSVWFVQCCLHCTSSVMIPTCHLLAMSVSIETGRCMEDEMMAAISKIKKNLLLKI